MGVGLDLAGTDLLLIDDSAPEALSELRAETVSDYFPAPADRRPRAG